MYVRVMPSGAISFRLDYRLNGRRETVSLGRYGRGGISLARARELCLDARREVREGRSPAIEKQRDKRLLKEAKSFGEFGGKWLTGAPMADSTCAMRHSIFERELLPAWRNRLLTEITPTFAGSLREVCRAGRSGNDSPCQSWLAKTGHRASVSGRRHASMAQPRRVSVASIQLRSSLPCSIACIFFSSIACFLCAAA